MTPLSSRILLAALLAAGLAAPVGAQERQEAPPAAERRAQPRAAGRPARSDAPARARAESGRQERAPERARGTDSQGRVRAPRSNDDGGQRGGDRATAGTAPVPPITFSQPQRQPDRRAEATPPNASASADEQQRRARPRGSRDRGDNPATGRAVPRDGRSYPRDGWGGDYRGRSPRVYSSRGRVYNNYYYYYPRRYYPYGYGAFGGLGYFYYDPYRWYSYDPFYSRPYYYGAYRYDGSYYDTGELRIQVVPRHAEVYVDGYFAGSVDDFDGTFQALRLEEGPYKIEIAAPGYEPLEFDVRIQRGRKITYRGELRPRP